MMKVEFWDKVRDLFDEVSQHPPEKRGEALAALCPDDEELRLEVLSLLEHDDRARPQFLTPLEHPAADVAEDGPDPLIGTRIGKCTIERVIAAGGMGVVYEARQDSPQRTVAVKLMKSLAWSRSAKRRFEFEVQSLARLVHPNIAQIYDADTVREPGPLEGTPYFVMEYIADARPITQYADEHKLDKKARLELFLQACDAVHYGHQRGIIHRDLKPANMLVSVSGQVKVIDFGVARATDSDVAATTQLTDVGQLIGTLRYMSPEQCQADPLGLDVRSDVYALGVVLYELLCGRPPYEVSSTSITQAARAICEEPPRRPGAADRSLRGDLEVILLKSLEKSREKRYQSVADLSCDIRHYLNREPIEARGITKFGVVYMWVRKHPLVTTAMLASLIGSSVLLAILLSVWVYGFRPYQVVRQKDGQEVTLLSAAGKVIHKWKSDEPGTFMFADLIEEDDRLLVVIGESQASPRPTAGKLLAFDANRGEFEDPIWTNCVTEQDMPKAVPESEEHRGFKARDFCPAAHDRRLYVADVFPQSPGRELVLQYQHAFSRRLIRIISVIDGRVLWQIWHDGDVNDQLWLPEARLLVLAGSNAEVPWPARGGDIASGENFYPWVVWAARPELGQLHDRYVCTGGFPECVDPAWYWCVLPPSSTNNFFTIKLGRSPVQHDGTRFLLKLFYRPPPYSPAAGWILGADGQRITGISPYKNDAYLLDSTLPRIEDFYLDDLPSVIKRSN